MTNLILGLALGSPCITGGGVIIINGLLVLYDASSGKLRPISANDSTTGKNRAIKLQ